MQVIRLGREFLSMGSGKYWDEIRRRGGRLLVTSEALQICAHEVLAVVRDKATPPRSTRGLISLRLLILCSLPR